MLNRLPFICRLLLFCLVTALPLVGCQPQGSLNTAVQAEDTDYGCAYFYFLWGRQAELDMRFSEALEAYEKALICDPEADYIVRKIPIILLRMDRGEEAVAMLQDYLEKKPEESQVRMLLARVYIGLGRYEEASNEYRTIHLQDPQEIHSLLLLSELHLNRGDLAGAEEVLKEVLAVNSESYPAHVMLARIFFNNKEYDQALAEYQLALEINWSSDLLMEISDVYIQQEKFDRAIALYRDILQKESDNERASLAMVNFLLLQKKEDEALAELNRLKALSDRPDMVDLSIAKLYARLEKYDKAIDILKNSLKRKNSTAIRYLLAVIMSQAERYEEALTELQMINREADEYEKGIIMQVRILRYLERTEQAVELLEKAVRKEEGRSPDMYVMLAALYQLQDKSEKGRDTFDRALSAFPEDYELLYEYGLFLDTLGSQDEAISMMEEVIKRQPEHGEALNYVGYSWADRSVHLDKALDYIQRAVKLKPENGYIRDSLGWVYYRLGKYEKAREALEEAVRLSPDDPTIFDHLGDVYLVLGEKEKAIQAYRDAIDLIEEDTEAKKALQDKVLLLELHPREERQ